MKKKILLLALAIFTVGIINLKAQEDIATIKVLRVPALYISNASLNLTFNNTEPIVLKGPKYVIFKVKEGQIELKASAGKK